MDMFGFILVVVGGFLLLRNQWAYVIQRKALDVVSQKAQQAIENGERDWQRFYDEYNKRSYERVLFDLTIWTPRQAYPWLYAE